MPKGFYSRIFQSMGATLEGLRFIPWVLIMTFWGLCDGCSINERRGPNLPGESKKAASSDSTVIVNVGNQRQGRQLYERYCEDCHNMIEASTKRGATKDDIVRGISRVKEMAELDRLKINEISAIAEALK
jgi:hypothetical protein